MSVEAIRQNEERAVKVDNHGIQITRGPKTSLVASGRGLILHVGDSDNVTVVGDAGVIMKGSSLKVTVNTKGDAYIFGSVDEAEVSSNGNLYVIDGFLNKAKASTGGKIFCTEGIGDIEDSDTGEITEKIELPEDILKIIRILLTKNKQDLLDFSPERFMLKED